LAKALTKVQRIVVVCRLNAARSILVGAALKKFAAEFEIVTCGVEAITGNKIPQITYDAAVAWGLRIEPEFSLNIRDISGGINFEDIVLVSDGYMRDSTYLENANPANVFSFGEFALDSTLIPRDPIKMTSAEFKREIAKAIFCTSRVMNTLFSSPTIGTENRIESICGDDQSALDSLVYFCEKNSYNVLLANFEIPVTFTPSSASARLEFLNFEDCGSFAPINQGLDSSNYISIFCAKYEMTFRDEDFFSENFQSSAMKLASKRPLVIVFDFNAPSPRVGEIQLLRASQVVALSLASSRPDLTADWRFDLLPYRFQRGET
jgi:protein-tyrosine-phosphatase